MVISWVRSFASRKLNKMLMSYMLFIFSCQGTCYLPMVMALLNLSRESILLKAMSTASEWLCWSFWQVECPMTGQSCQNMQFSNLHYSIWAKYQVWTINWYFLQDTNSRGAIFGKMGSSSTTWYRCFAEDGWSFSQQRVSNKIFITLCWYYCTMCSGE